ncbi:hypothetical protein CKO28_24130 [Rhodovibrio sodomensis]|uniref:Pili assembly chaperone N-terminal domain-containing protein n=1 Tax=Rhodovibrio sodomensis TaxID=1088 RepID=A0ABS1DKP9_9PROT|nr:hypothetical protein [Rhodovibrio sodomensis]MBK1671100.1 hypothetical protein [Rhodovibrio sodomensis]
MKRMTAGLAAGAVLAAATAAQAQGVSVPDYRIELDGEPEIRRVVNNSDTLAYVRLDPVRIENPGTDSRKEISSDRNPREVGLMVSPRAMKLAPGETRTFQATPLGSPDKERVWRIKVRPVVGPRIDGGDNAVVKILQGVNVLAIDRARDPEVDLGSTIEGGVLTVRNDGNASALMTLGEQCAESRCEGLDPFRLHPGTEKEIDLPLDGGSVEYRVSGPNGAETISLIE